MPAVQFAAPITGVNVSNTLPESQAAPYCGFTRVHFAKLRSEGRGPAYLRIGRSIRYLRSDLDAWLQRFRVATFESGGESHGG